MAPRGFEDMKAADQIALDIGSGLVDRIADPRLAGEVDDDVGRERVDRPVERLAILEHRLDRAEAGVLEEILVPPALEQRVVIIGHAVIADDVEPFVEEVPGKMIADETRRPGDRKSTRLNSSH